MKGKDCDIPLSRSYYRVLLPFMGFLAKFKRKSEVLFHPRNFSVILAPRTASDSPGNLFIVFFLGHNTGPINCTVFSRLNQIFWRDIQLKEEFCQVLALLPLENFTVVSVITTLRR